MTNLDKLKKKYIGMLIKTKSYGSFVIVDYLDKDSVKVRFERTGYEVCARISNVVKGKVSDKLQKGVKGVGIKGDAPSRIDGVLDVAYTYWCSMLIRCYDQHKQGQLQHYKGCSVSEHFKNLEYFSTWCRKQKGFDMTDDKGKSFQLDKDILVRGNKVYSEDTCCFVPQQINKVIMDSKKIRGVYPVGVTFTRKRFRAAISRYGKFTFIGNFDNAEDAFCAYKEAKETYIKELAVKWKDRIDARVYEALMSWEVSIDD